MAVVADTTWLIDISHGHAGALALLDQLTSNRELLIVPAVVAVEYLAGSNDVPRDLAELAAAGNVEPFTVEDAVAAAALARKALKAGSFPGWMDVLIAGAAKNRGDLRVVTRNPKHFPKSLGY